MGTEDKLARIMRAEQARKEKALQSNAECSLGDAKATETKNREHGVAETLNGVAVGWRNGFFDTGHIVALFYWTGSCERSVTLDAAEAYAELLNDKRC